MATARIAVGALMETVSDTAQAASSIVNTVAGTVHILNDFVQDQRTKQQTRIKISNVGYTELLIDEATQAMALRKKEILNWIEEDEANKNLWDQCHGKFSDLFPKE